MNSISTIGGRETCLKIFRCSFQKLAFSHWRRPLRAASFNISVTNVLKDIYSAVRSRLEESFIYGYCAPSLALRHFFKIWIQNYFQLLRLAWIFLMLGSLHLLLCRCILFVFTISLRRTLSICRSSGALLRRSILSILSFTGFVLLRKRQILIKQIETSASLIYNSTEGSLLSDLIDILMGHWQHHLVCLCCLDWSLLSFLTFLVLLNARGWTARIGVRILLKFASRWEHSCLT